jgi:KDO2-lipid IV(A) lauroyltransferase
VNAGHAFALAWKVFKRLPLWLGRALFSALAVAAWFARGSGVRQLEQNLARLRPGLPRRDLRRLSLAGMRSYMRYYCETFQLPAMTGAQIDARVRAVGLGPIEADLAAGRSVVMAVAHCGNWDLAGAWGARNFGPVVSVVEKLEPEELFREFLEFRESLGMTIVPFVPGGGVFRELIRHARTGANVIPLLADRDLSRGGVEVVLAGHLARVATGPAALSLATGARLFPARVRYERLRGARRRAAGGPWGLVLDFDAPLVAPADVPKEHAVAELTQDWVDSLTESILAHPQDWHMLQKVFVEDLDPARRSGSSSAAARAAQGSPA